MLSPAQRRLVRLLARHPPEVMQAWDVPRELSLPGLADAMGVVRSALHHPLQQLSGAGLVQMRLAHVVGGGSRRRQVHHLTDAGRRAAVELGDDDEDESGRPTAAGSGTLHGAPPVLTRLAGREALLAAAAEHLETEGMLVLSGVAGMGASATLRGLADAWTSGGRDVRWHTLDPLDGIATLAQGWMGDEPAPSDPDVLTERLVEVAADGLLVIDELHQVHGRHEAAVLDLLDALRGRGVRLAIATRAPSPWTAVTSLSVDELQIEPAESLLDPTVDEGRRAAVLGALGGHPQALLLHDPTTPLPEAGTDLRRFLAEQVLDGLDEEAMTILDALAATVIPVDPEQLPAAGGIEALDARALLRWRDGRAQLLDMVRNVRRAAWDAVASHTLHRQLAEHWDRQPGEDAVLLSLHHRLHTEDQRGATEHARRHLGRLLEQRSDGLAALLDDGLRQAPDDIPLRLIATEAALERGEREAAERLLEPLPETVAEAMPLRARLRRLAGAHDESRALLAQAVAALPTGDALRLQVSELARQLDDRLPGQPLGATADEVAAVLEMIELDALPLGEHARRTALVALASVRHALALEQGDTSEVARLRDQLAGLSSDDDPIVLTLALRAELAAHATDSPGEADRLTRLRRAVAGADGLIRREALRLQLVERLAAAQDLEAARGVLDSSEADLPPPSTRSARRLLALRWWWRGVVDPAQRLQAWREAQFRLRAAECPAAAQEVATRLMRAL